MVTWQLSAFSDEAGGSADEQIVALKKAGYNFTDLRSVDGYNIVELPVEQAKEVRRKLDDNGIGVNMFGSPIGKLDIVDDFEVERTRLKHLGELAPIFDCRRVRMFSYYNRSEKPMEQWQNTTLQRLSELKDLARECGLVLYHENERHIFGDLLSRVEILRQELRDRESFFLIFDFDNYNQSGEDVWACWQSLCEATDAFHLKDSDSNNQHVPLGEGAGQAKKILADAAKRGWQGPVVLEPHLKHSAAVAATGPSGQANQKFSDMTAGECFHHAAEVAKAVITEAGAEIE